MQSLDNRRQENIVRTRRPSHHARHHVMTRGVLLCHLCVADERGSCGPEKGGIQGTSREVRLF